MKNFNDVNETVFMLYIIHLFPILGPHSFADDVNSNFLIFEFMGLKLCIVELTACLSKRSSFSREKSHVKCEVTSAGSEIEVYFDS